MSHHSWLFAPADEPDLPAADSEWLFGGASPAHWTHTRATAGMGRGPDGRWTSYPADTPRPYHDPITQQLQGVLAEPARTQLIYSSRPLVANPAQATLTTDTTTQSPFGLGGAVLIPNTANVAHGLDLYFGGNRAAAIPDNANVSLQLIFKPVGAAKRFQILTQQKTGAYKFLDLTTDGGGSILSNSMQWCRLRPETDGFFRLEFGLNYGAGTSGGSAHLSCRSDTGARVYASDGTSGIFIAYYGAEVGTETTSPILSNGTGAMTRAEDIIQTAAPWMMNGEKSFGIEYTPDGIDPQVILHGSGSDSLELRVDPATVYYSAFSGGTNVGFLTGPATLPNLARTTVITAGFNQFWLMENGRKLKVDEDGNPPSDIGVFRLGGRVGGGAFACPVIIKRVKYWAQALDREAAAAFSADLSIPGVAPILPVIDVQASRTVPASENRIVLTVTLTGEPAGASVSYTTIDGTAKAGIDYTAETGVLTFVPGQNVSEIAIDLGTRSLEETRTFSVELYVPVRAVLGTAACVVTLTKSAPAAHAPSKAARFDGPLSADWTLTRSTTGYARGGDGVWAAVPAGQPRLHHVAAGEVGLLLEPAGDQCLFESAQFGYTLNSTKTNLTNVLTPTGMRSMRWRETATTGNHLFRAYWDSAGAVWPTGDMTLWCLIKPVGPRVRWRIALKGVDNVYKNAIYTLEGNGAVVSTGSADVIAMIEPEPMWPGWYRLGFARKQGAGANVGAEFDIGPLDPVTNSNQLAGDITYGLDICHFQVETGLVWNSPIPVTAATTKTLRSADVLKAAGGWQTRNSFALGVKFRRNGTLPSSQRIVQFRDIAPSVDDFGILTVDGTIRAPLTTGTTFHGNIDGPVNAVREYATAIASIDTTRYALFTGGAKAGEIAMAGKPMPRLVEHLRFGSKEDDGSQGASIVLHSIAYWTVGLSDEEGNVFSADLSGTPPGTVEPDPLPTVSIPATLSIKEGSTIEIPITKIGNGACSVSFATKAQTASWNADYIGVGPVTVSFAANESTKLVQVQTLADTLADPDEKFGIAISAPVDCVLGNAIGVVTIAEPPRVSVPTAISVAEGGVASVIITKAGSGACSVTWRTMARTASWNVDYTGQDVTVVSFAANETSKTVTVQTLADAAAEQPETFEVVLENPVDCSITTAICTVTIIDPTATTPPQTAYTTADGFASAADCGLGHPIYRVTNLNDSGDGSLRAGVVAGNCMIIFEVAGTISLASDLTFGGNLTIAGETAPAPGITIAKREFIIQKSNVRVSHVTFQKGYAANNTANSDVGKVGKGSPTVPASGPVTTQNIHFSHCAFYWNMDESVEHWPSKSRRLLNISYHDCIFTEALWRPSDYDSTLRNHDKLYAPYNQLTHNYGVLVGYYTKNIDFQYCMFSEFSRRSPFIDHSTQVVIGNCISLNCGVHVTFEQQPSPDGNGKPLPASDNYQATIRGYLAIGGPRSGANDVVKFNTYVNPQPANSKVYTSDLYGWKGGTSSSTYATPLASVGYNATQGKPYWMSGTAKVDVEVDSPPIDTPTPVSPLTAQEIYDRAIMNIGPRPKEIRSTDAATPRNKDVKRTISRLTAKTGKWVNHEDETDIGGFYFPTKVTRTLNSTAKFADDTLIGAVPDQPQPSTATSRSNMKAWLRKHLDRLQYD